MDPAVKIYLEAMELVKPIEEATERGDSDIQNFYKDATLFLTGGTGFIGKQLLEKLFRSCDIKRAFVLIRPKRGVPTEERLRVMLDDPVFEPVLKKKPDFKSRIVCVDGDVAEIRLGISDEDWDKIVDEVDIIFHGAATIRFDESIRSATIINVRGTREALKLGKACKKLRSYIHVSTAYCHATTQRSGGEVLEQFYESPVPPETMLQLAETVNNDRLDAMTASLITDWPNTYAFTKAIAEELVRAESGTLPVGIVRPSIVISTDKEPIPGWLEPSSIFGPSGIVLGVGLGVLHVLLVNNKSKLSFVPVDYVNNATIAAGWETGTRKIGDDAKIYNISSTNCGVTFKHISTPMRSQKIRGIISPLTIGYCYLVDTNNIFVNWILNWLLHYIPAYIADAFIKVMKIKTPKELKSFVHTYTKFNKLSKIFEFFLTNEWNFDEHNLQNLWRKMSKVDRTIYNFDMKTIDWDHLTCMWCLGVRKYVIKDGMQGTVEACARQKWFKLANFIFLSLYILAFWMILIMLRYIWSCIF